jgi:chromosome segregation ATPase
VTSLLRHRVTGLEADAAAQHEHLSRAKSDGAAAGRRANDLAEQCALAEAQSTKMQQRIEELSALVSSMQAEREELIGQRDAQNKQLLEARRVCAAVLADAAALESRARRVDDARAAAAQQLAHVHSAAAGMCGQAVDAAAALEAAAAEKETAEADAEQLAERVSCQQVELQSLRAKSALLQSSLSAEKSRAEAAAASLQAALQTSLSDLDNTRMLLEDTQVRR